MDDGKRRKKKANAVFEGGGVKGIGIAGALTVAGKYYDWVNVAGTSAGAIVASLVAAGYSPEEIKDKIYNLDYKRFEDADYLCELPVIGSLLCLKFRLGINKGNYIEEWVRENLKAKGVRWFGDFAGLGTEKNSPDRYKLRVIASDITAGKMLILPNDIAAYGIDPDYLDVATAIRMSVSIPFYFEPVVLEYLDNKGLQNTNYIVDGGVLSNFPVWLFDDDTGLNKVPTIGFKLVGPEEGRSHNIEGPISMLKALIGTMMEAHDNRFIKEKNFDRTIKIPTLGIRTTDFNIRPEKIKELFQSGVRSAEEFFGAWDYFSYQKKHLW
jgi:NTE family protein